MQIVAHTNRARIPYRRARDLRYISAPRSSAVNIFDLIFISSVFNISVLRSESATAEIVVLPSLQ